MRMKRISFVALALIGLGLVALGLAGTSAGAVGGFLDGERDPAHPYDAQIRDNRTDMLTGRRQEVESTDESAPIMTQNNAIEGSDSQAC